jgi:hypothetical protein
MSGFRRRSGVIVVAFLVAAMGFGFALEAIGRTASAIRSDGDPSTFDIACGRDGLVLNAKTTDAAADGVHITITADGEDEVFHAVADGPNPPTFTVMLDPGMTTQVLSLPPGNVSVGCFRAPFDAGRVDHATMSQIEILDPNGYWTTLDFDCDSISTEDGIAVSDGESATPETVIRAALSGLSEQDEIVRSGYRGATDGRAEFAVVRDGHAVASLVIPSRDGMVPRAFNYSLMLCPSSGVLPRYTSVAEAIEGQV